MFFNIWFNPIHVFSLTQVLLKLDTDTAIVLGLYITIHRCIVRSYSRLSDTGVSNRVLKNRDSEGPLQEIS